MNPMQSPNTGVGGKDHGNRTKEQLYIISDRYGYWQYIEAVSPDEAVRLSSNLAPEADLDYATTSYVGEESEISDEEFERHNCAIAMDIGGHECRCGGHE